MTQRQHSTVARGRRCVHDHAVGTADEVVQTDGRAASAPSPVHSSKAGVGSPLPCPSNCFMALDHSRRLCDWADPDPRRRSPGAVPAWPHEYSLVAEGIQQALCRQAPAAGAGDCWICPTTAAARTAAEARARSPLASFALPLRAAGNIVIL